MTRLLIIQHEDNCGPGWFGEWWEEAGAELSVVAADREPVPDSVAGYDALVVLGGAMGATDDATAPWLPAVRRLIAETVRADRVPFLGICLGHQLAAVALGGEVGTNAELTLGLTPVGLTEAGCEDALLGPLEPGSEAIQYNHDHVVRRPDGALVLASAPDEHVQALRYGPRAWGVQFHPECTPAIFDAWTVGKPEDAPERRALLGYDIAGKSAAIHAAAGALTATWRPVALRFLELAAIGDEA